MAKSTCILRDPIRAIRREMASLKKPPRQEDLHCYACPEESQPRQDCNFSCGMLYIRSGSRRILCCLWQILTPCNHGTKFGHQNVLVVLVRTLPSRLSESQCSVTVACLAMEARASLIPSNPNIQSRTTMAMLGTAGYQKNSPTMVAACKGTGKELSYW